MKWHPLLVLLLWVSVAAGCAANPGGSAGDGRPRQQANLIAAEEIQQAPPSQSAFDLIRARRPNWLQARGVQSLGSPTEVRRGEREPGSAMMHQVIVYVDGTRLGGPDILRQLLASQLQEARYLGATEASTRFGSDHPGGAILITMRR